MYSRETVPLDRITVARRIAQPQLPGYVEKSLAARSSLPLTPTPCAYAGTETDIVPGLPTAADFCQSSSAEHGSLSPHSKSLGALGTGSGYKYEQSFLSYAQHHSSSHPRFVALRKPKMETKQNTFGLEKRDPEAYPLNEKLYPLNADTPRELEFWKSQTGIQDEEELRRHIIKIQTEAHGACVL